MFFPRGTWAEWTLPFWGWFCHHKNFEKAHKLLLLFLRFSELVSFSSQFVLSTIGFMDLFIHCTLFVMWNITWKDTIVPKNHFILLHFDTLVGHGKHQTCKINLTVLLFFFFYVFFMTFFISTVSTGDGPSSVEESVRWAGWKSREHQCCYLHP